VANPCYEIGPEAGGHAVSLTAAELALLTALADARSREEARRHAAALIRSSRPGTAVELEGVIACLLARAGEAEDLRRLATLDPLTGIANRRAFTEALERDVARADRRDGWLALAVLDLDGFKELNDRLGHAAGDRALVEVARACEETLRRGDLVARLGGDELAVLLPDTTLAMAEGVAARLRRGIEARAVDGHPLRTSIGIAAASGRRLDPAALLQAADESLYDDKRRRRKAAPPSAPAAPSTAPASDSTRTGQVLDDTTYAFQQSSFSTRVLRRNVPVPSPSSSLSSQ